MSGRNLWNLLAKLVCAGAVTALLAGPAAAQMKMPGIDLNPDGSRTPLTQEEKEKQKAIDDKYKESMQKIPDKQAPVDPWGNIRSAPATNAKQR